MSQHSQSGAINILLIPLIGVTVLLLGAIGFGAWSYTSRQDYKNNTDQKIAAAVTVAKQQESSLKDQAFLQTEKLPLRSYAGPAAYGSIVVSYPKTWSAYVDDTGTGSAPLDGYFYPATVPSLTNQSSTFALRTQVVPQSYTATIQSYNSEQQSHKATVAPYAFPRQPNVVGSEVTGQLANGKTGVAIIVPLRANTLEVWTEGNQFISDFNNIILPNFTFSP